MHIIDAFSFIEVFIMDGRRIGHVNILQTTRTMGGGGSARSRTY